MVQKRNKILDTHSNFLIFMQADVVNPKYSKHRQSDLIEHIFCNVKGIQRQVHSNREF